MNKAIFFDRDGTINVDKNYLYQVEKFEFLPGVRQVLSELRRKEYLLILITNQSGIARGYYTIGQMNNLHEYMQRELKKYNAQFDEIMYCPHYSKGIIPKYTMNCKCRKPGTLLYEQAIEKYDIVPEISIAVGDKDRDLIPAKKLGMKCIKISNDKDSNWITLPTLETLIEYV